MSKPYSQPGEKGTDTNQASEDELMRQLGFRYEPSECGYYIHKFVKNSENPSSLNSVLVPEVAKQIQDLIRTEKLKLLAEVRERVVGEGDLVDAEILKKLYDKAYSNGYNDKGYENSYNSRDYRSAEDIAPVIAKIRGGYDKRFAALNKLEAEL